MTLSGSPLSAGSFDELALFVEIARAGSVTAAARRLGLPKSTVSRALSRLEQKLGVALLRRSTRGPSLTEQGQELSTLIAGPVASIRDAADAIGRDHDDPYGTIRITAPIDLGQQVLGPLLPAFVARYPRVTIDVDISMRFVDVISEGVDIALRVSGKPLPSSSLRGRKLATVHLSLYAAPRYLARAGQVKSVSDLAAREHVLFQPAAGAMRFAIEGPSGVTEITARGRLHGNDFHFVRAALVAGGGIGMLPWFLAQNDVNAGRLCRVLPRHGVRGATVYLLHAPTRPLPRKIEVLRDYLIEHTPAALVEP